MQALLAGETEAMIVAAAQRADWIPPRTLTAVLVPEHAVRPLADLLCPHTLHLAEAGPAVPDRSVLLIPDAGGGSGPALLSLLRGQRAVIGPAAELAAGAVVLRPRRAHSADSRAARHRGGH